MTETTSRVRDIIREHSGTRHYAAVEGNSDLRRDLRADDLDLMCISIALEMEFGIDIGDAEFAAIETVADIEALVGGKVGAKADD